MKANRDAVGPWESFTPVSVRDGHVAFKAKTGKYMSCQPDGTMQANRDAIGPWEVFEVWATEDFEWGLAVGDYWVAIRSVEFNKFVSA